MNYINEYDKKDTIYVSKIHINCGYCALLKGCKIRKSFIETSEQFSFTGAHRNFDLKCDFKTPKYSDGQIIKFTVAYGVHDEKYEHQCDWDCDQCQRPDNCVDGVKTFINKRYEGNVQLIGIIDGYIGKDKYVVEVSEIEYLKLKPYLNDRDVNKLKEISEAISPFSSSRTYIPYFVTKQKFIIK